MHAMSQPKKDSLDSSDYFPFVSGASTNLVFDK